MEAKQLIQCLLDLSEQSANLARLIREDKDLFQLLIASKDQRANGEPDFKTLADVLIQSTFKYGVKRQFPGHNITVMGEEDGTFPLKSGEHVELEITEDPENTARLLSKVLKSPGVVEKLCSAIHRTVSVHDGSLEQIAPGQLLPEDLSVWIDPIDSTKSYISGDAKLESVTVLVGVHHAGLPILGVVTYPFTREQIWGLAHNGYKLSNVPVPNVTGPIKTVVLSRWETDKMVDKLRSSGFQTEAPTGAGFKLGTVIKGEASFYLVTASTTFQWDTCGPHAILRALGGDIELFGKPGTPLRYTHSTDPNVGFIAYLDSGALARLRQSLKD